MVFVAGGVYATDDFSLFKCAGVSEGIATLSPMTSRSAGVILVADDDMGAWLGPFMNDDTGFGFGSIVRDYYSGTNYVVINDLIDDGDFKMTLVRSLHDASLIVACEPQNLILNVAGDVVEPWPAWIGQQSVSSDDGTLEMSAIKQREHRKAKATATARKVSDAAKRKAAKATRP